MVVIFMVFTSYDFKGSLQELIMPRKVVNAHESEKKNRRTTIFLPLMTIGSVVSDHLHLHDFPVVLVRDREVV